MSPFVSSPPLWPSSSSSHPMSLRPMSSPPRLLSPPFLSSSRQHITYTTIGPHVHMALTYPLHAPRSLARSCLHFFCLLFLFSLFISVRSISILFCSFAHLVLGSYVRRCLPVRVRCGNNLLFLFLFLFMSGSGFGVYIIYTYTYNTFTVFFCFVLFPPFHPFFVCLIVCEYLSLLALGKLAFVGTPWYAHRMITTWSTYKLYAFVCPAVDRAPSHLVWSDPVSSRLDHSWDKNRNGYAGGVNGARGRNCCSLVHVCVYYSGADAAMLDRAVVGNSTAAVSTDEAR